MREIIEHGTVVTSNGENINFQDVLPAGFQLSCYTKDTVFACSKSRNNLNLLQTIMVFKTANDC
jgi:hypothetical protein